MDTSQNKLRPMRVTLGLDFGSLTVSVPRMPEPVPPRPMAPNRLSPAKGSDPDPSRPELLVTLPATTDNPLGDLLVGFVRYINHHETFQSTIDSDKLMAQCADEYLQTLIQENGNPE